MRPDIRIDSFDWELPSDRIAKYPLEDRDASKILIYEEGINSSVFSNLAEFIPDDSIMVFNNTKVIAARMFFQKESGAIIEIFALEPFLPRDYNLSFSSRANCRWRCVVGNAKKWKEGLLDAYTGSVIEDTYSLKAQLIERENSSFIIEFSWSGNITFAEILDYYGIIPIPPYLQRESEQIDDLRYQTLYARFRGSVAAPTAGLHFTDKVMDSLRAKGIIRGEVCLHVGAGTFIPVKSESVSDHIMHNEPFSVSKEFLEIIYNKTKSNRLISVGTTSVRTLESLYYLGLKCRTGNVCENDLYVSQWDPYESAVDKGFTYRDSVEVLLEYLDKNNISELNARTGIIIVPSYEFKAVDGVITNFHQPRSTLLLLISAFIGESWREVYRYALDNGFRFLSYGDSSLLWRSKNPLHR